MNYLSDAEKNKIMTFNADIVLVNAVKKVLLEAIYNNGVLRKDNDPEPTRNAALSLAIACVNGQNVVSDEHLGQDLRGMAQGVLLLEQGLAQLAKIKKVKEGESTNKDNPGI